VFGYRSSDNTHFAGKVATHRQPWKDVLCICW